MNADQFFETLIQKAAEMGGVCPECHVSHQTEVRSASDDLAIKLGQFIAMMGDENDFRCLMEASRLAAKAKLSREDVTRPIEHVLTFEDFRMEAQRPELCRLDDVLAFLCRKLIPAIRPDESNTSFWSSMLNGVWSSDGDLYVHLQLMQAGHFVFFVSQRTEGKTTLIARGRSRTVEQIVIAFIAMLGHDPKTTAHRFQAI